MAGRHKARPGRSPRSQVSGRIAGRAAPSDPERPVIMARPADRIASDIPETVDDMDGRPACGPPGAGELSTEFFATLPEPALQDGIERYTTFSGNDDRRSPNLQGATTCGGGFHVYDNPEGNGHVAIRALSDR